MRPEDIAEGTELDENWSPKGKRKKAKRSRLSRSEGGPRARIIDGLSSLPPGYFIAGYFALAFLLVKIIRGLRSPGGVFDLIGWLVSIVFLVSLFRRRD